MAKNKQLTQEVRSIETSLINKDEVFRMLALAEATQLPILLVGKPGTAKTKTVIEYSKAWLQKDGALTEEDFINKLFVLETDEGTKSSEVKGLPDMESLFSQNKYELYAPITKADVVVINEVDKASSNIRNSLLGVMNEKFLFNGKDKVPCKWKLFVATCNEIPKEEEGSPFWDRFILKMTVSRVSAGQLVDYFRQGGKDFRQKLEISVPSKDEIDQIPLPVNKMEQFLSIAYSTMSDRTITFVPTLVRAVMYIWNIGIDKALVKVASIMLGNSAANSLQDKLYTPEIKNVLTKIESLHSYNNKEQLNQAIQEIESLIGSYASKGKMTQDQVMDLDAVLADTLESKVNKDLLNQEEILAVLDEGDSEIPMGDLPF